MEKALEDTGSPSKHPMDNLLNLCNVEVIYHLNIYTYIRILKSTYFALMPFTVYRICVTLFLSSDEFVSNEFLQGTMFRGHF